MPVYVEPRDLTAELGECKSVLIVCCPVCPPMCLAMQQESPFIDFFKSGLKTPAFEDHVRAIRVPLEQRGVRTGVYSTHFPTMMMCLWTEGQRQRLLERVRDYEAAVVLGCDSAVETATQALEGADCRVIQGMETKGIVNASTKFRWPLRIDMERRSEPNPDSIR